MRVRQRTGRGAKMEKGGEGNLSFGGLLFSKAKGAGINLGERRGWRELGGVEQGETVVRVYCMG